MTTTIEVLAGELVARKPAASWAAQSFGRHRTLCTGILYGITIIAVLGLVARL